jgi:hypothetical protein
VIVRKGGGRTAGQGDGAITEVIDDRGQLLRGQILEVGFPVSACIDAYDLYYICSFMLKAFLERRGEDASQCHVPQPRQACPLYVTRRSGRDSTPVEKKRKPLATNVREHNHESPLRWWRRSAREEFGVVSTRQFTRWPRVRRHAHDGVSGATAGPCAVSPLTQKMFCVRVFAIL